MDSTKRTGVPVEDDAVPAWRRWAMRFERALSDLIEASDQRRRRPRNLYVRGNTAGSLMTRRHGD